MDGLKDKSLFRQQGLVAGVWRDAASGGTVLVENPATGATLGTVPDMGRDETKAPSIFGAGAPMQSAPRG